jgi:hypothetical protein
MRSFIRRVDHNLWRVALAAMLIVVIFALGGASRADAQSHLPLRLIVVLVTVIGLAWIAPGNLARTRIPLIFLGLFAALLVLQLVPLPPSIWRALPGHENLWAMLNLAGTSTEWRSISLQPDNTWNSLFALIPAVGVAIVFGSLPQGVSRTVLALLLSGIIISGLVGLLQITTGNPSLYLYRITNPGSAVGLFANRNHQGVMLATALPMLAAYAALQAAGRKSRKIWGALGAAAILVPLILVTGSRAALVLAVVGAGAAWILYQPQGHRDAMADGRLGAARISLIVGGVSAAALATAVALSSRALSVHRLFGEDVSQEVRVKLFMPMLNAAWTYFPLGTGFGTFVDVFKMHEPLVNLDFTYLNHAHNELLELAIEGGLPSLLIASAFLLVWGRATIRIWKGSGRSEGIVLARLGSIVTGMLMIASLADYPLRTPIISSLFVLMLVWMFGREQRGVK